MWYTYTTVAIIDLPKAQQKWLALYNSTRPGMPICLPIEIQIKLLGARETIFVIS